jgi:hypothetical protein
MVRSLLFAFLAVAVLTSVAMAGNNPEPKVAVHVRPHWAKQSCTNLPYITRCEDILFTEPGCNIDAFPVFFNLTEYLGFEYGMCWDPPGCLSSCSFTNCADLVIGDIKFSGDGISQTWFNCIYAWAGVPGWGWFYAYCPARICVCPHPASGHIYVLDCQDGLDEPIANFCGGVCGALGDDPCEPTETNAAEVHSTHVEQSYRYDVRPDNGYT